MGWRMKNFNNWGFHWKILRFRGGSQNKGLGQLPKKLSNHTVSFSWNCSVYIYTLSIMPYMEYCCHVWVGDPSCYLELFRQQKQKCSTVVSSFASSFELLAYRGNEASLRVFSCCYCYYMISVTISRCYKDVSFFAQLESGILCL